MLVTIKTYVYQHKSLDGIHIFTNAYPGKLTPAKDQDFQDQAKLDREDFTNIEEWNLVDIQEKEVEL